MNEPDFYLASADGVLFEKPRRCWRGKRIATNDRNDLLLIRIDPPLDGQNYGGSRDIDLLLVAPRHEGGSLFPINEWPIFVHIARPLIENAEKRESLQSNEIESIAWGELYQTEEDARSKAM